MVTTRDVRLGSFLMHIPTGKIVQVTGISNDKIFFSNPEPDQERKQHIEDYEPVTLTEEWTKKMHFEQKEDKQYILTIDLPYESKGYLVAGHASKGWFVYYFCKGVFASENLHYVHQVQNIFQSLMLTELPIN